jgi:NitT/TauT family transport system substrate-binding protein
MEIYQLKVFLEVARCLSFTEAADALNLTQPAVSAKIKSLESSLETPLFRRLGRRIKLTQVGEYLLEEGPQLVDLEVCLIAEIEEIKRGKFSTLTIGCMADVLGHWLPSILYEYRRIYPDVQTKCQQFDSIEKLYRAIKTGNIDLGISDLSFSSFDEISEVAIGSVQYSLVVSSSHQLAQRPWLSLKELTEQSWVLSPKGFSSRFMLQKRMGELGLDLNDLAHVEIVNVPSLMRTYLLQGHYLGFASDFEFQIECQAGLLRRIPLEEFALGTPLFLLMAKRLGRALDGVGLPSSRGSGLGLEPIRQFIALVHNPPKSRPSSPTLPKADLETSPPSSAAAIATAPKVTRFQAPNFLVRSGATSRTETIDLTIGTQNRTIQTVTAGLIIQRLGLLEHFLPRQGRYGNVQYRIHWSDYSSGAPIVAGLEAEQIDIGILGDYPLLLSAASATQTSSATQLISFVAGNPDGTGNDIIVPQHSVLDCIDDLAGRVIAVPFGSAAHGMVMRSLHHRQMLGAVTLTALDTANAQRSGRDTTADGYAYFAPFHEIAKHRGQFRRLRQENLDGLPTFHGVVIRTTLAEQYPEIAVAYLQALLAAQYWYASQPMATSLVSRWVNMDATIVAKTLKSTLSDRTDVMYFPETQLRTDWLQAHIHQMGQIVGQEKLGQINLDRWMQTEFLERAIASL